MSVNAEVIYKKWNSSLSLHRSNVEQKKVAEMFEQNSLPDLSGGPLYFTLRFMMLSQLQNPPKGHSESSEALQKQWPMEQSYPVMQNLAKANLLSPDSSWASQWLDHNTRSWKVFFFILI